MTEDIEALDVGANAMDDAMDIDSETDANEVYLSEGDTMVFPCTIRYIDLTILNLEYLDRVPHLMLIRDKWRTMVDIFNGREKGIWGGAAFAGQPGIGGYCDYSWSRTSNQRIPLFRQDLYAVLHPYPLRYPQPANSVWGGLCASSVPLRNKPSSAVSVVAEELTG